MTIHRTPRRGTPRRRVPPSQIDYVIVDKPSGHCPKCRKYVPDKGVMCKGCNAFWHYACAGVSQETLDVEWEGVDWLCKEHIMSDAVSIAENTEQNGTLGEVKIRVNVNSYTLNPQSTLKKLQKSIQAVSKIDAKDKNQQYYVKLCLPTFEILVANMIDLGEQWGLSIKAGSVDQNGSNVGAQFNLNLRTPNGLSAQTSVNCFPTTSSLHIQLNKGSKGNEDWDEKVECLSSFVYHVLGGVIKQIEQSPYFEALRENMLQELVKMKELPRGASSSELLKIAYTPRNPSQVDITTPVAQVTEDKPSPKSASMVETEEKISDWHSIEEENENSERDCRPDMKGAPLEDPVSRNSVNDDTAENGFVPTNSNEMEKRSLDSLRLVIQERNEEISKLKAETKSQKRLLKDLDGKLKESDEKDVKISKIMNMKEQLGSTIQTLKEKLNESDLLVKSQATQISAQDEEIKQKGKIIAELNIRTECNKEVATLFMDQILEEDGDEDQTNSRQDLSSKEQVAKLFNELSIEQEKVNQLQVEIKEANSEIASLKLIHEEEVGKHKVEKEQKNKEIKSLKSLVTKMEKNLSDKNEEVKTLGEELVSVKNVLSVEKAKYVSIAEEHKKLGSINEKLESDIKMIKSNNEEQTKLPCEMVSMHCQTDEMQSDPRVTTLKKEKTNMEKQLESSRNNFRNLETSLEEEKKKYTQLSLLNESLKAELATYMDASRPTNTEQNESTLDRPGENEETQVSTPNARNDLVEVGNVCYREALQPGSCVRGVNCRFSHHITSDMRSNQLLMDRIASMKEEKLGKCVNEFFRPGSCRKKDACRFSHKINDNHRQDQPLRRTMEEKLQRLQGQRPSDSMQHQEQAEYHQSNHPHPQYPLSANYTTPPPQPQMQPQTMIQNYPNIYQPSTRNPDSPTVPRPLMETMMSPPAQVQAINPTVPRPLMETMMPPPAQVQAINLIQNLMSQLLNTCTPCGTPILQQQQGKLALIWTPN